MPDGSSRSFPQPASQTRPPCSPMEATVNPRQGVPIGCRSPPKRGPYSTPIHTLGVVPPGVLSAGTRSLAPVPAIIPGPAPRCPSGRTSRLLRRPRRARRAASLRHLSRAVAQGRVGGLRQETVRRTAGRARVSVALHPPRRYLQSPADLSRRDRRLLQVEGLPDRGP